MYLVHKHVNKGELTCIFKYKVNMFFHNTLCCSREYPYLPPPHRAFWFRKATLTSYFP